MNDLHKARPTFQDLRSYIVGSSTHRLPLLPPMVQLGSQSKVTDPDFQGISQQQVAKFKVSVNNELILEVLHGQGDLPQVVPSLDLSDSFPSFDELVHGLSSLGCTWLVQSSRRM